METVGYLYGGAAVLKKYQVAQTVSNIGVVYLASTEAEAGLDEPTTTNFADAVGINYDTATYATAQVAGGTPEATITVDVRPDAIIKARLSGGGTTGTALTLYDVTTASTDGLSVTTGDDWSSPEFDDGAIWGYDGANAGQLRKITSTSSTAATVTVAFANDTVVGDNFLRAPFWPMDDQSYTVTATSNFLEVDASVACATNTGALLPIELIANDIANNGRTNSYVLLVCRDHWLNNLA